MLKITLLIVQVHECTLIETLSLPPQELSLVIALKRKELVATIYLYGKILVQELQT